MEKEIKRLEIILEPKEYRRIFSNYATVKQLGKDCHNFDFKESKKNVLKQPGYWHFQITQCKRLVLTRNAANTNVLVQGEPFYRNTIGAVKSICKKGKTVGSVDPNKFIIKEKNTLKPAKKVDIDALLSKHYGQDWREIEAPGLNLNFYKHILDAAEDEPEQSDDETDLCEPQEAVLEPRI